MSRAVQPTLAALYGGKRTSPQVSQTLARLQHEQTQIQNHLIDADRRKQVMNQYSAALSTEPVVRVLYQVGASDTQVSVWREYRAWRLARDNVLCLESERRVVQQCSWQEDTIVVTFDDVPMRFFVTPLSPVHEALKHEQLREGDTVLLCGHYLVVVEATDESYAPNGVRPVQETPAAPTPTRDHHLRVPQTLRQTRPEQELHFHNGLPELEAGERLARGGGYGQAGYDAGDAARRRPVQRQGGRQQQQQHQGTEVVRLEMVVNWLRVTGVETAGQQRVRGALRQTLPEWTRSFLR